MVNIFIASNLSLTIYDGSGLQGKKNPGTDVRAVRKFMKEVSRANPMKVDRYCVVHNSIQVVALQFYLPPSVGNTIKARCITFE